MDKTDNDNMIQYNYNNNIITVERFFIGTENIQEVVKRYILEKHKIKVPEIKDNCYNNQCDMTVADLQKEGKE